MKNRYILKTLILEDERFLFRYVVFIIMIAVVSFFSFYEVSFLINYPMKMWENQKCLSISTSDLYQINFEYYKMFHTDEEVQEIYDFIEGINNQNTKAGVFFYSDFNEETQVLCISESLLYASRLKNEKDEEISFDTPKSVIVGYSLKKQYPLGTIVCDEISGQKYIVSDYLKKGSYWLDTDAVSGTHTYVKLDDKMVISLKDRFSDFRYTEVINGLNSAYCYSNTLNYNELSNYVEELADKYGIIIYPLCSLKERNKKIQRYSYSNALIEVTCLIVCILLTLSSKIIYLFIDFQHKKVFYGKLLVCGWTRVDLMKMVFISYGSQVILGTFIGVLLGYNWISKHMEVGNMLYVSSYTFVFVFILGVFETVIYSILFLKKISKMQVVQMNGGF